ncbi:MAG: hypothetical protein RSG57_04585 [Christensenellaceae bacterium]
MDYELYLILKDIVKQLYGDNVLYSKFYVKLIKKESDKTVGRYNSKNKTLEICNLSRSGKSIFLTALHLLAHHVDMIKRRETKHDRDFYVIYKGILLAAMSMGFVSVQDFIDTGSEVSDVRNLCKYVGNGWDFELTNYAKNIVFIKIYNAFLLKDILKSSGYRYDGLEEVWYKRVERNVLSEEKKLLISTKISASNVKLCRACDFEIDTIYYICIKNAFEYKEQFKQCGYRYNGYGIEIKVNKRNKVGYEYLSNFPYDRGQLIRFFWVRLH